MGGVLGQGLGGIAGGAGSLVGNVANPLMSTLFGANNFAPGYAPMLNPTDQNQLNQAGGQVQTGLQQQQDFLNALQGQNGIQNQSAVYNQLSGIANGTGPNPAQAALNQSTGQNIASQAALMAGQRGAGANVGLLARQAAMQGGNLQQQAVGQGATLQAQQQLGAINAMGNLSGQQVANQANATNSYAQTALGQQGNLISGANGYNSALAGEQNNANTLTEKQDAGNKGIVGGILGGVGNVLHSAKGGPVEKPYADGGMASSSPSQNLSGGSDLSNGNSFLKNGPQSFIGQHITGEAPAKQVSKAESANGSSFGFDNSGFQAGQSAGAGLASIGKAINSGVGNLFSSGAPAGAADAAGSLAPDAAAGSLAPDAAAGDAAGSAFGAGTAVSDVPVGAEALAALNKGGVVPAKVSPGEVYLKPKQVKEVAEGKRSPIAGEKIPGKAKVKGDSLKNDTVSKNLEEGGFVIPKSIMESKDPAKEAHAFVMAHLAKKGLR